MACYWNSWNPTPLPATEHFYVTADAWASAESPTIRSNISYEIRWDDERIKQ